MRVKNYYPHFRDKETEDYKGKQLVQFACGRDSILNQLCPILEPEFLIVIFLYKLLSIHQN